MMTKSASKKRFDCVEMMHQGAAALRKELDGKSLPEQMLYWRKATQALLKRQEQLRSQRPGLQRQD